MTLDAARAQWKGLNDFLRANAVPSTPAGSKSVTHEGATITYRVFHRSMGKMDVEVELHGIPWLKPGLLIALCRLNKDNREHLGRPTHVQPLGGRLSAFFTERDRAPVFVELANPFGGR